MRRQPITLPVALLCACAILSSCKKDGSPNTGPNPQPVPPNVHLDGVEIRTIGNTYRYSVGYDAQGRINQVTYKSNTEPISTLFNVAYDANSILLTRPKGDDLTMQVSDTIRFSLDGSGNVLSRIQNRYVKTLGQNNDESKTWMKDTIAYSYNGMGMLSSLNHNLRDTSWSSANGVQTMYVTRKSELANYTVEDNKLISVNRNVAVWETSYDSSGMATEYTTEEWILSFQYTKNYPNKTDFSNTTVLNELHQFTDLPLNSKWTYLPDRVNTQKKKKNKDGVVYMSTNTNAQNELTFNAYGFVVSKEDPANPGTKVIYMYNK